MKLETAEELVGFIERFKKEPPLYELSEQITLAPYLYGEAISSFINFCLREEIFDQDCYAISDEFSINQQNAQWFESLGEEQVCRCIGLIIRQDRFIDGLINKTIEDGTMLRLLGRLKVIYAI